MINEELKIGDSVKLLPGAVYYTGRQISPLIKSLSWVVTSISGARVLLGQSTDGYYNLNAPVDIKYLVKAD